MNRYLNNQAGVLQRGNTDCGVAALATLLGSTYEEVAKAWKAALNRNPGCSTYRDLLAVLEHLGITARKVKQTMSGIRRVRWEAGSSHSHWVVLHDGALWCPTAGWFEEWTAYPMRHYGHGIEIELG